ncbi:hypothetical protein C4D60_Mb10t05820 [Musa balbisiana]|uniref:Fe2OG dioxygenase domain-containing protein n=1 Tax=Musa balbisiana TaxID=52838 RepID=A0A4S8IV20_MUSBA|nr:hypothetical protein C4D60_Mb10t05820 [Musa balbisiana]
MEMERVQVIASVCAANGAMPPEFIRSEHEQPGITTYRGPAPEIPVIDLAGADQDQLTIAVAEASREWGIFQLLNHGIPGEVIRELQRVGMEFFELPQEEKENQTSICLQLSVFKVTCFDLCGFDRKVNEHYGKHLACLVDRMLMALSRGLGLGDRVLKEALGGVGLEQLLKINYYPPCPRPDLALGVVAHTDISAITILVPNHVPGLQVFKDEHWIDVNYVPDAAIVHVGDQIEILSNGIYKSVLHRTTVNKEKVRMSWPVFCSPPGEMVIGPLQQLVGDESPPKYKAKKYKDYAYCKLNKLPQ